LAIEDVRSSSKPFVEKKNSKTLDAHPVLISLYWRFANTGRRRKEEDYVVRRAQRTMQKSEDGLDMERGTRGGRGGQHVTRRGDFQKDGVQRQASTGASLTADTRWLERQGRGRLRSSKKESSHNKERCYLSPRKAPPPSKALTRRERRATINEVLLPLEEKR